MNQASPNNSKTPTNIKFFLAAIVVIVVIINVLILWWWFTPPKIVVEADAGFKRAKQTIDPEKLRVWAMESIKRWPATNGWHTIPQSEIPQYIQNLYSIPPENASVAYDKIVIFWGGGFFHWVIEVGSTNFVESTNVGSHYQTVEWTRGIYYSHEGNRKIQ